MESLQDMWEEVCNYASEHLGISDTVRKLWFTPITLKSFDGQSALLTVSNSFLYPTIVKQFKEPINKAFNNVVGFDVDIEIELDDKKEDSEVEVKNNTGAVSNRTIVDSFENFVVGKSNSYAYAAAKKVAEDPGESYNPLYIYGKSGLGKTHLLKAIENELRRKNPDANIIYITSENFTNDLVYHIRTKSTHEFHEKYRNAYALLVDDIQFIAQKEQTEEEFFHTFNALTEYGRQIVLTSDRPPNEIPILQERLKQRFEWGLMVDIQPPDFETRMAIIKNKADHCNLNISNEIVEFIASSLKNNVRQIESSIKKMKSLCDIRNKNEPSMEEAKEAIKELTSYSMPVSDVINKIIENVSNTYGISVENILSDKRDKNIKNARHISIYIIREITGLSLLNIGEYFGGKTHTTIKHSYDYVKDKMEKDFSFKKTVEDIIKNIQEY